MTYRDIVTNALRELNVIAAEDAAEAADAVFVLGKMNRILDRWNGSGLASYVVQFVTYTLTPSLQPHTIGPTGTFTVPLRPEEILGANRIDGTVRSPIRVRDEQWWLGQTVRALTGTYVTDVYYRPNWPNGDLNFWPVPSNAGSVELETAQPFAIGTLNTTFTLPPGFEDAVTLTLAEEIAEAFGAQPGPKLMQGAANARAQLFSRHGKRYPLTSDRGLGGRRGWWDYRTGMDRW